MSNSTLPVDPCILVIFGASGDLTARKLVPSMYEMAKAGLLPAETRILGVARRPKTADEWREAGGTNTNSTPRGLPTVSPKSGDAVGLICPRGVRPTAFQRWALRCCCFSR